MLVVKQLFNIPEYLTKLIFSILSNQICITSCLSACFQDFLSYPGAPPFHGLPDPNLTVLLDLPSGLECTAQPEMKMV